jgi:hypothetical protein
MFARIVCFPNSSCSDGRPLALRGLDGVRFLSISYAITKRALALSCPNPPFPFEDWPATFEGYDKTFASCGETFEGFDKPFEGYGATFASFDKPFEGFDGLFEGFAKTFELYDELFKGFAKPFEGFDEPFEGK